MQQAARDQHQEQALTGGDAHTQRAPDLLARAEQALRAARDALLARQDAAGYWCFPFEADCTIPAEYILMMHFMDEIDAALERKLCVYLRACQEDHGGWPLYPGGDLDVSCSVKAYFSLKLAGDDPDASHMRRARDAILARGGAVQANVFTHIALALFGEIPWRGVPFMPVEIVLLPRWFPFHLDKVSYWSRTVMVPLMVLYTLKPRAKNPRGVSVRELFTVAPEQERGFFKVRSWVNRVFIALDRVGRTLEPLIPRRVRARAMDTALQWIIERRNGEGGLGAIFPAMVNAYEVFALLGYAPDHPYRRDARRALEDLLFVEEDRAYCQPCVSPVWDTCLASLALEEVGDKASLDATRRGFDWLLERQLLDAPGDWQRGHAGVAGGGWAFQFRNDAYPDLDDTAAVAWAMHQAGDERYRHSIRRAADWLCAMQSRNGGFAAFDSDNEHYYLNEIPFADHGALLDPPTSDVSARVAALLGRLGAEGNRTALDRTWSFLRTQQAPWGGWLGRWGTNYIYGTWSVLSAAEQCGFDPHSDWIQRAVQWLKSCQNADGGWGESNSTYFPDGATAGGGPSTPCQSAWAILALLCAGEGAAPTVVNGLSYLLEHQRVDGLWDSPYFNAPGFPRVFYLKYHGYNAYFPLWALARFRRHCQCEDSR